MRIDTSAQRFLAALARIDRRAEQAQRQIGSGKKLAAASDAPDLVGRVLAARARLEEMLQLGANLGRAKTEVDTAEQALETAVKVLERINQLAVQGATETQPPAQRRTIGHEVGMLLEQLVAVAATAVEGRHIFSGDNDQVVPYTTGAATPTGISAYAGSDSTRELMHPAGSRMAIARTAQEIFEDPDASAFAAVAALGAALENGPVAEPGDPLYQTQYDAQTDAIDAAMLSLRKAHEHVGIELSFYGVVQQRVDEAIEFFHTFELRLREELSALEDADLPAAILELTQAQTHRETALAARGASSRRSLFDYLG